MTTASTSIAPGLVDAQRRYRRISGWFWFFVACIPLGVVLPCIASIVAYQIWGDTVSAPVGLSALLWPIVGVAGALLLRGGKARARRSLELARLASSCGLEFTVQPAPEKYGFLRDVSFMANPHYQQARNLLEGTPGGRRMLALDYEYTYSWGSVSEVGAQTLVVFPSGFERLPHFGVVPTGVMGRLENFLLGDRGRITLPHASNFAQYFAVVGDDPAAIAACFSPQLVNLFMNDRLLTLLVEDGRLLLFRRLTYVPARDYQAFLAEAVQVANLLAR
jgi:hypothetical protein